MENILIELTEEEAQVILGVLSGTEKVCQLMEYIQGDTIAEVYKHEMPILWPIVGGVMRKIEAGLQK